MTLFDSIVESLFHPNPHGRITREIQNFYWLTRNHPMIVNDLKNIFLRKGLKAKKLRKMNFPYINDIPKIVNRICSLYKDPPKRKVLVNGEANEQLTEVYNNLLDVANVNAEMQDIHKLAYFYNTINVLPYFKGDSLSLEVILPFQSEVIVEDTDPFSPTAFFILRSFYDVYGEEKKSIIVWENEKHYLLNYDGTKSVIGNNAKMINPYGELPFATLRMSKMSKNYWGESQSWLVEHYRSISCNYIYTNYILPYMTGGLLVARNINFAKENPITNEGVMINNKIVSMFEEQNTNNIHNLSPDSIFQINDNIAGKEGKLEYVTTDSNLKDIQDTIEWTRKLTLNTAEINMNSITLERGYTSGYGIMTESLDILELRKQHIPLMKRFENELYRKICLIAEVDSNIRLDPTATIELDYVEPSFPKNGDEIIKDRADRIKYNISSFRDLLREGNADIKNDEEADEILQKNAEINKKFSALISVALAGNEQQPSGAMKGKAGVDDLVENEEMQEAQNMQEPVDISGATMIDFPELRQALDYSCGASALQGILMYYGFEYTESQLVQRLKTTENFGTDEAMIKQYAEKLGLTVDMKEMTIDEVKTYITNKCPVILDIQAWSNTENMDYTNDYEDGHYVVAIGYTESGFILEDPSSMTRQSISFENLQQRWHDVDGQGNKTSNLGIAIYGLPIKFNSEEVTEIG